MLSHAEPCSEVQEFRKSGEFWRILENSRIQENSGEFWMILENSGGC